MIFLQAADAKHGELLDVVEPHNRRYCARWGISYRSVRSDARTGYQIKTLAIQEILPYMTEGEVMAFVDNDVFLTELGFSGDLSLAINPQNEIALAEYPPSKARWHPWNDGVMLLRNTPRVRKMIDEALVLIEGRGTEAWINSQISCMRFQDLDARWNFMGQLAIKESDAFAIGLHGSNFNFVLPHMKRRVQDASHRELQPA